MKITIEEIINYIVETLEGEITEISAEDNLIELGIMDSLMVMELIDYIEEKYEIEFAPDLIVPENFETVGKICNTANSCLDNVERERN